MDDSNTVVRFGDVSRTFAVRKSKSTVKAVTDVNLQIEAGTTLALVGESGSGKTTIGRMMLGLLAPSGGTIEYFGTSLDRLKTAGAWGRFRAGVQAVFQDPLDSLDPRSRIGATLAEPLRCLRLASSSKEIRERSIESLSLVGLAAEVLARYPGELSGGVQQRVGIARALVSRPKLIVLDEPTSGLSPTSRGQVLETLRSVQKETGVAYLFITHDLAVVESIADVVAVMYLGRIVEQGAASTVFRRQAHPYSRALLESVLYPDPARGAGFRELSGEIPSPIDLPPGCAFASRCRYVQPRCEAAVPKLELVSSDEYGNRLVACYRAQEILSMPETISVG